MNARTDVRTGAILNALPPFLEWRGHNELCFIVKVSKKELNNAGHLPKPAGTEPGELGDYRRRLIDFLQSSTSYRPEELLPRFPMNRELLYIRVQ